MAHLLRLLLALSGLGVALVVALAHGWAHVGPGHILLAIPVFIGVVFVQAFVMFYFIGVARLVEKVLVALQSPDGPGTLFDEPPADPSPWIKRVSRMHLEAKMGRRRTVPWSVLAIVLGTAAFLLGGAFDTGLVGLHVHGGVAHGFCAALGIGTVRQWAHLGRAHRLLRRLKALFDVPAHRM